MYFRKKICKFVLLINITGLNGDKGIAEKYHKNGIIKIMERNKKMNSNVLLIKNNISYVIYNARNKELNIGSSRGILTIINQTYEDLKKIVDKMEENGFVFCCNRSEINIEEVVAENLDFVECVIVFKENIISVNYIANQNKICINTNAGCLFFNEMTEDKYETMCRNVLENEYIKIDIVVNGGMETPDFSKIEKLK